MATIQELTQQTNKLLGREAFDVNTGKQISTPSSIITTEDMKPTTSVNFATPVQTMIPDVTKLNTEIPQIQMTEPERVATDLTSRLIEANRRLVCESTFRTEQETTQGISELQKTQTDLSSQLKAIQNEAQAIPLQLQQEAAGRGVTTGGLQPIQTARLRANAIQALGVSSLLEASRGNLATAQDMVDRAVRTKYDPIREEINSIRTNLDIIINSPEYSIAEKNRATQQKARQDEINRSLQREEQKERDIYNVLMEAARNGADTLTLDKIKNSKNPSEALVLAGDSIGRAFKLDLAIKQQQLITAQKQYSLLGEPSASDRKKIEEGIKNAKASVLVMQDKIDAVDVLLQSDGLNSRVGPNPLSRKSATTGGLLSSIATGASVGAAAGLPFGVVGAVPGAIIGGIVGASRGALDTITGEGQAFAGGVHKLVSGLSLDSLIEAKARGATFGALSDAELSMLSQSATAISDWEIKDKNGRGTGVWNIDEVSFKKELENIQRLTRRAITLAQENVLDDSEQSIIDELFSLEDAQAYY